MPILWRYLLKLFLKITFASLVAFVAILLTMQLDEIAHFAALGAPALYLLFFTLHQIPYILPIALPLSCLIASYLLVQRLSASNEMTTLRASGFSLLNILTPILFAAAFLSIANFWIVSELATQSHLQTNLLKNELRSVNPLLLLNNKHIMRLKGFYFTALGDLHNGESASDVVFAIPNKHQQRIHLFIAKKLKATPSIFAGEGVTLITSAPAREEPDFDQLLIENMRVCKTQVHDFSKFLQKKVWTVHDDYLKLPLLLSRIKEQNAKMEGFNDLEGPFQDLKSLNMQINRSYSEIVKRLSISLAVFSFTFMGSCFGLSISRRRKYYPLFMAVGLTTLYLISFFVAKGLDHRVWLTGPLYLLPHLVIISASLFALIRIGKGIET